MTTTEQHLARIKQQSDIYTMTRKWRDRELQPMRDALAWKLRDGRAAGLTLRQLAEASGLSPEGVRGIINRETKEEGR